MLEKVGYERALQETQGVSAMTRRAVHLPEEPGSAFLVLAQELGLLFILSSRGWTSLILSAPSLSLWAPSPDHLGCFLLNPWRKHICSMFCRSLDSAFIGRNVRLLLWPQRSPLLLALLHSTENALLRWVMQPPHSLHSCRDSITCLQQEQVMLLMTVFNPWDHLGHTGSWNCN